MTGYYNGYTPTEREAKFKVLLQRIADGVQPEAEGPCMLCGDPDVPVMYHDEDYSLPYLWEPPALLCLCRNCHLDKLHQRFRRSSANWKAFLAHIRRGGYARDITEDATIKKEVHACRQAIASNQQFEMRVLRPYSGVVGSEWFASLSLDAASKTDPLARPRP